MELAQRKLRRPLPARHPGLKNKKRPADSRRAVSLLNSIQTTDQAAGFFAAGRFTGGFLAGAFSLGKSSSFTLALSQCSMKAGSGS